MINALTLATCQFPVSADISLNATYIGRQMQAAAEKGAAIAHFSESSLNGYAGVDFMHFESKAEILRERTLEKIARLSARLKIWAIIGGHCFEKNNTKPFNCLWLIDSNGKIIRRYDKRFCTGKKGELEHFYYKPGKEPVQFKINGFTCGLLICHEWRYPELYREQKKMGTEIIFQSWYDGHLSPVDYQKKGKELGSLITGAVRGYAANNHVWISASNTSGRESCFAAFVVQPDGKICHQLRRNVAGILISKINRNTEFEDPSGPWRKRAIKGILHSGRLS